MSAQLEVPQPSDLDDLSIEVIQSDEPGVVSLTAWANDGAVVTLTWDEIAGSVLVTWMEANEERVRIEREMASKVSVREDRGQVEFWVWTDVGGLGGQLVVRVGEQVGLSDVLLRQ
jgi:hypothetical protein